MTKLAKLESKRHGRVVSRKVHFRKYEAFKKRDKKVRAAYHLRKMRADNKAVKKLNRAINAEEQRIAKLRIDWNGLDPVGGPKLREVLRYGLNNAPGTYVTSTNGGTHAPTSHHYNNDAVDIGASTTAQKVEFQKAVYKKFGASVFAELFGPNNYPAVKNGNTYTLSEGDGNETLHDTHFHMAILN
jgi:hypothetical protein